MQRDPHPGETPVSSRPVLAAPAAFHPSDADVAALISAAAAHPLGLEYLLQGHLGTVAITFGCHAFVVAAARDRLLSVNPHERPA